MKQRVIYVCLTGGLGNQLFQYAHALSIDSISQIVLDSSAGAPRINNEGSPEVASLNLTTRATFSNKKRASWLTRKAIGYCLRTGLKPNYLESLGIFQCLIQQLTSLLVSLEYRSIMRVVVSKGIGFSKNTYPKGNIFLIGYNQTYKCIESENSHKMLMTLTPIKVGRDLTRLRIEALSKAPIVVHVRLTDYKLEESFGIP